MIVPYQEILEFTGQSDSFNLQAVHKGIEDQVKRYIDWEPEQVTHTNKRYDGTGYPSLYLEEEHIQRVTRVAVDTNDAIKIYNSSLDATNAFVEVTSSAVRLVVEGGANASDNSITFASQATMSAMVTAINALSKGWVAAIYDTDFNSYPSSNLLQTDGFYAGSWDGVTATYDYILMAGGPINDYVVYKERGEIRRTGASFPRGSQNIAVSYISGYALADMPEDLQLAVMMLVKEVYNESSEGRTGIKSYSLGHLSVTYAQNERIQTAIEYLAPFRKVVLL